MSDVAKIFVAIALLLAAALILGALIAVVSTKFKVETDERAVKGLAMLPGANCGACGYAGCSGMIEALVSGKVTKVRTCKVINEANAQKLADYLNSAVGPDGSRLHVTAD